VILVSFSASLEELHCRAADELLVREDGSAAWSRARSLIRLGNRSTARSITPGDSACGWLLLAFDFWLEFSIWNLNLAFWICLFGFEFWFGYLVWFLICLRFLDS
jgi:hypothetical protein